MTPMILQLLALAFVATASPAAATSQARHPLRYLQILQNASIRTPNHRVSALSHFDIEFPLQHDARVRLSLEPNHDVLGHGASINHLDAHGIIVQSETIDRLDHKVFKGAALAERLDGSWESVGWARISVSRDGIHPLFEGAFSVNHDNHHVQLRSSFMRTKHGLDPDLEHSEDEYMVMFRDSDIPSNRFDANADSKRDLMDESCTSDRLEFNTRPDHPVYRVITKRHDSHWGALPMKRLFGKRQLDTQGSGNTAGVNLASTIGQTAGCPTTRKIALVGVATDCGYTGNFNSTDSTKQNVISVMNAASAVWESTFNISLGLQNLTISDANCPGTPQAATPWNQNCDSTLDITSRLNLFSAWRGSLGDQNSHWTLLTACPTGSAVGLAWLGQVCVHDATTSNTSTGVSETVSGANVVALTSTEWQVLAHETGHTMGARHDCDSTTCTDGTTVAFQQCCPYSATTCSANSQYIMNPYTSSGITEFSACTIGNICSAIGTNGINTTCLSENNGVITVSGATCGNGIVEEGEQCDCGGTASCGDDTCCDPTTCTFTSGAVCDDANEDCCTSCQFAANGTICRASTGSCDPAEMCSGTAATCPIDVVAPSGQACSLSNNTSTDLACASGQCTSRNYQCQTVMAGYISPASANSTYACDAETCTLSCASPAFGTGVCYGLQQNLLDGTPCGGGGRCSNGACKGSTFSGEVKNWVDEHKGVVIGIAVAVGLLVLLALCCCIVGRCRRSKSSASSKIQVARPARPPPMPPLPVGVDAWYGQSQPQNTPRMEQQSAWPQQHQIQYEQLNPSWRPLPPLPPPFYHQTGTSEPPLHQQNMLYGNGIIGSQSYSLPSTGAPSSKSQAPTSMWDPTWQPQPQSQVHGGVPPLPPLYPTALRPSVRSA